MEKKPQAGATELGHVPATSSPYGEPAPTEALQGMGFPEHALITTETTCVHADLACLIQNLPQCPVKKKTGDFLLLQFLN